MDMFKDITVNQLAEIIMRDDVFCLNTAEAYGSRVFLNGINNSRNYRVGVLETKKNGEFGFVQEAFVHSANVPELRSMDEELVIARVKLGNKGLKSYNVELFTDEGCQRMMGDYYNTFISLMRDSFSSAYAEKVASNEKEERTRAERDIRIRKEKAEKMARITSRVGNYTEDILSTGNGYRRRFSAMYYFNYPISMDDFKWFIQELGHKAEAKPCFVPICAEEVSIKFISDNCVRYDWAEEYTD